MAQQSFMCPGSCRETISISQATDHFIATHKAVKSHPMKILISTLPFTSMAGNPPKLKRDLAWPVRLIESNGKNFLGHVYSHNGFIYWTLFYIGTEEEAANYGAEITFSSGEKNGDRIRWTVSVQPIVKCEELRDGDEMKDVFIPNCNFNDFKKVAVRDDVGSNYRFITEYKIWKRE